MEFGGTTVVNDLSFDAHRGETFGFLGSNGSGKTTTLRALLGIYKPTAGVLYVDGRPFTPETGPRLGYLPEERGLYKKESVIDVMTYFGRLKGLGRKASAEWSVNYLERVGLGDKARTRVEKLSGGEQQRVAIARAVVNKPAILLADEPTGNLDPATSAGIMTLLERINLGGTTVLMATHDAGIVDQMKRRVIELISGQIVRDEKQGGYQTQAIPTQGFGSFAPSAGTPEVSQ